jgi:hypothetical protein
MSFWYVFIKPYAYISFLAAYGLAQNLEGIGLFGYINGIYEPGIPFPLLNLDPTVGVKKLTGLILVLFPIFLFVIVRGGFVLGVRTGSLILVGVLAPGVISAIGFDVQIPSYAPEEFLLGSGYLGGFWNSGVIFIFSFVLGWGGVLLVANFFKSQKFKHVYDHIWCCMPLVGCLYLVVASQAKFDERQVVDLNQSIQSYLQFYQESYSFLALECVSNPLLSRETLICSKVFKTSKSLSEQSISSDPRTRRYQDGWLDVLLSKDETSKVNLFLCGGRDSNKCRTMPSVLALTMNDLYEKILIPIDEHSERVRKLYTKLGVYVDKIKLAERHENIKYFLFCFVSVLAGGKAATSSISLVGEANLLSRSWGRLFAIRLFLVCFSICKFFCRLPNSLVKLFCFLRAFRNTPNAR